MMASEERAPGPPSSGSPGGVPAPPICEIRVIDNLADLAAAFRLRHDVYGALGYLGRFNSSRLEIDEFDSSAIPFGAFDPASGDLIGALRLITVERQPDYAHLVRRVVADARDAELTRQAHGERNHRLPSVITAEIDHRIDQFNSDGFMVHELSRIIVRPGFRGSGVSRALMEIGLAHAAQYDPAVVIGSCLPEHIPMFARYGYLELPGIEPTRFAGIGPLAHAVICRTDQLPEPTRSHVEELLSTMASGARHRTLEVGRDARAIFRFTTPRRSRRRTVEW